MNQFSKFNRLSFLQRDARWFQIIYLSLFLLYGLIYLNWDAELDRYIAIFVTCIATQLVCTYFTTKNYSSIKSALISALGLCLLLKTNLVWTAGIAAVLTITSKFLIRVNYKHVFNPVNFGIIATLLLTGDAWISPGQWGSSAILVFFFGAAALMVLLKVGRIDTSMAFLGTYLALELFRSIIYKGWPVDYLAHQFSSGTILLFAFFMITDPVTTPNAGRARILWAALVGMASFILGQWFFIHTAPLWALFFISPLTVLLDKFFIHPKFQWT